MSAKLPDGATVSIATAYATAKTITAVTNAAPPIASSTTHGLTAGDIIALTSGWSGLNDRVFKVTAPTADTIGLVGADSTNAQRYPVGGGGGAFRKISAFQQITQILGWETSGGEQQYVNYSYLEDDFERQLPSSFSAQSIGITIADDASLPGYIALKAASDSRVLTAIRLSLVDGSSVLYNGIISLNESPNVTKGQVVSVRASIALQSRPVRA